MKSIQLSLFYFMSIQSIQGVRNTLDLMVHMLTLSIHIFLDVVEFAFDIGL